MAHRSKKQHIQNSLASVFDLPRDIILNLPRITLIGALQVCIENHRGIIEYTQERIRINLEGHVLALTGTNLAIGTVSEAEIIVEGNIEGLQFQ